MVLSTLALVQASSELGELKRYVENGEFLLEASDLGVVNLCAERKLPFVAGHALNCYNAVTLRLLLKQGMTRWCMPVELSATGWPTCSHSAKSWAFATSLKWRF